MTDRNFEDVLPRCLTALLGQPPRAPDHRPLGSEGIALRSPDDGGLFTYEADLGDEAASPSHQTTATARRRRRGRAGAGAAAASGAGNTR